MYCSRMPARGDHDARRRDVSEAVWRVVAERGFTGLTLRAVAAAMGASTGLLTHYFPTKRALVRHAVAVADERTATRDRRTAPAPGLPALRAALLDVLSLTGEGTVMNRVWVGFWGAALAEDDLTAGQRERYGRWRAALRGHVLAAGLPEPDDAVATAAAFTHGLVVQALFDPDSFPPERQIRLLDRFLEDLVCRSTTASPPSLASLPAQAMPTP